jgi:hypothetical protein
MQQYEGGRERTKKLKAISVVVPAVLLLLAYLFDSEENMDRNNPEIENGILNVSRHSFSCSMRFQNRVCTPSCW